MVMADRSNYIVTILATWASPFKEHALEILGVATNLHLPRSLVQNWRAGCSYYYLEMKWIPADDGLIAEDAS